MPYRTLEIDQKGHHFTYENRTQVEVYESPFENMTYSNDLFACGYCGKRAWDIEIIDDIVYPKVAPCPLPEGVTTKIKFVVKSGKIIVSDSLGGYGFSDEIDYNSALGQAQAIETMAEQGCAYGPVGNSCPALYRTGDETYIIGRPEYDDDGEPKEELGDKLAWICTDLWAYSIADYDDWVDKGGDPSDSNWTDSIIEFPNGTYEFSHHTGEIGFDHYAEGPIIFAHVKKISD